MDVLRDVDVNVVANVLGLFEDVVKLLIQWIVVCKDVFHAPGLPK